MSRLVSSLPPAPHIVARAMDGQPVPDRAPGPQDPPSRDDYVTKVAKYVPVEFVGGYLFFQKLVSFTPDEPHTVNFQA